MKLLVDVNLSPRWVFTLQAAGFEALHWSQIGGLDAPDATILQYAIDQGYTVLTHNLDFSAILAATGITKPSVIQLRAMSLNPDTVGNRVIESLNKLKSEIELGALVTIDAQRARVRVLPFN